MTALVAGMLGLPAPRKVSGWRYGHIPTSGKSYNARDQRLEMGVSVMAIDGGDETQDQIAAMFYSNRPVVKITGWLNTVSKGGDGEPLVMYAKEI
jgi:hypothetical protein